MKTDKYWVTQNDYLFRLRESEEKIDVLPPGAYDIVLDQFGLCFINRGRQDLSELITLDDTVVNAMIFEVQRFWKKKELFAQNDFPFKRGILMHGPPGAGKSCAIKVLADNLVNSGGYVLFFNDIDCFNGGLAQLRSIHPDAPVIVVMEDIEKWGGKAESFLSNIMDGYTHIDNIVFLATTNYIDKLPPRIKNRPGRFDKTIYVGPPVRAVRKAYLDNIVKGFDIDKDKWANETEGFTFAHIKELYLAVCFFDNDFHETLERIRTLISQEDLIKMKDAAKNASQPTSALVGWKINHLAPSDA